MSSSPSAVALVVTPSASAPATSANKRKITPSAEQSSSKRQMIITTPSYSHHNTAEGTDISTDPFYAPKQLFPRGTARVTHAQPLPNTNASQVASHTETSYYLLTFVTRKSTPLGKMLSLCCAASSPAPPKLSWAWAMVMCTSKSRKCPRRPGRSRSAAYRLQLGPTP
jgi:hypothetical protein